MKILNLFTIIDKKHPLYVFYLKLQNFEIVGLFIPQGLWAEHILLTNASVIDVSTGLSKKYATPLPFTPSPHPSPPPYPPPQRQLTRANDIGPFGSCDLLGQWRAVPGANQRNPFRAPPPLLPSARKTDSSSGEKGLSLSEGLGKEYMKWRKTSVGKTGAQAEGRHVVIRASQG